MKDIVPPSLAQKMSGWRSSAEPWNPWPYQEHALKFMLENPQSGLFLDPGLGKTSISLASIKILLKRRLTHRVLLTAPLRVMYDVWPEQISSWSDFNELSIALVHGANKDKALRSITNQSIVLVNPEGFQWLTADKKRLAMLDCDELIVDESSKWKESTTVRFRCLRPLVQRGYFKRRHILTGSPRPRNYLDLFGQIFIVDRGAALGAYVSHYRNEFFYQTGFEMREWALVPGKDKEINRRIAPLVLRLDAEDYLKLPKKLERNHYVTLPKDAQREYDAIEDKLMSNLFDAPLVAAASARAKCMQLANGAVYLDAREGDEQRYSKAREFKVVHTAKVEAVVELYEELQGEPLLLCIGFHHDVEAVRRALGRDVPVINGGTTDKQASDYIDRWNKGLLPLMMMHPASAAHGLNLQKFNVRHVGYFFIPDDYDHYDQAFKRIWRQGNKADFVMKHHFISRDTVDEPKMRNLARKGTEQKDFLNAMREYCIKKYGRVPGGRRA